ncbi:protein kinase domain containing protein [Grosmannia clavigera kw1407]|uniref:Protein kinase domain containing protein n=1 Tax=Grosmannia clavigera (strain kw1407 / UAMH 11150) TaxID=655863 RepID=F0XTV9_GROCL|nr:protein kinase domain containing protein [Grosmannia clavigera kw1407]EFW99039.1 protein kinase domain containing protein [Grosmannia clavigera kw1407]
MWWDAATIERTVTRQYVCSHLLPDEIARLDRPLGFGDGLTDGTYWEWIDDKAKTIFLILVDLGVPDQIFGIIDDSWDDEDLPVDREQVERLALTPTKDTRFERKFFERQFYYMLTPLERGEHVFYHDVAVVPLDVVASSGGSSSGAGSGCSGSGDSGGKDRVVLFNYPGQVFARRRIPLAPSSESQFGSGFLSYEDFQYEANSIRSLQNDHLVSYWGSYVHQGYGYVLFTPTSDGSLKSLLATTPASIKNLAKKDRRQLMLNWIHCLVDTLCFLHMRGLSHGNIKPSSVLFNSANHVFFSDFTHFGAEMGGATGTGTDKASFDKESYDYAAPEQWYRPSGSGGHSSSSNGNGSSSSSGSSRKSLLTGETIFGRGGAARGMAIHSSNGGSGGSNTGTSWSSSEGAAAAAAAAFGHRGGHSAPANPQLNPQAADIFSLGCIILELLGFMLKRPTRSFAAHRAAKHKMPGRGGAVLDSSFHKNLGQVESWMVALAREAAGKKKDDPALAGVAPMLQIVERMLAPYPADRLAALDVQTRMYQILRDSCGIAEPHCVHQYGTGDVWDLGVGRLGRASLRIATTNYAYPHSSSSAEADAAAAAANGGAISPRSTDTDIAAFATKPIPAAVVVEQ